MNLDISRDALLKPIQQVIGVVERQQTLQVLANLLLQVRDGQLYVTANDLEVELETQDPQWRNHFAAGDAAAILRSAAPFTSMWVLRPFLEAYRVVAERLADLDPGEEIDPKPFLEETLTVAKQQRRQRRIRNPESVSNELFKSALDLATNRGITSPGEDSVERRAEFLDEINAVLASIDSLAGVPTRDS